MTLITALPFAVILLLLGFGLVKGMRADMARLDTHRESRPAIRTRSSNWQSRLGAILTQPTKRDILAFVERTAAPALDEVCRELNKRGLGAVSERDEDGGVTLTVPSEASRNFVYGVTPTARPAMVFSAGDASRPDTRREQVWVARTVFSDGSRGYDVADFNRDDLISDVLAQFERYRVLTEAPSTSLYTASPDPTPAT